MHEHHLYERHGKFDKIERDRKKMEREEFDYIEDEKEIDNVEEVISEAIYESGELTLAECVEKNEWGLLVFKLVNKYPKAKVIEMLKCLEEAEK